MQVERNEWLEKLWRSAQRNGVRLQIQNQ